MSDQTPQIKLIQSQRGKAVARTEQIIDELATFRSISGDYGSFWSDSKITVSAVAISVGSGQEIAKFSGIRLHSNRFSDYFRFCESYFDFDEIDDFLRGIEFVKSSMARMQEPSAESKQVYYSSNDDVHIGFYQPERDE